MYVYVWLHNDVKSSAEAWTAIRAGLDLYRKLYMPAGVLQTVVIDDFGNTSSLLLTVESDDRSPRELEEYTRQLCRRLRTIPEMGKIRIMGTQNEEISVTVDPARLSAYGIDQKALQASLLLQGFRTIGGSIDSESGTQKLQVPFRSRANRK